MGTGSSEKAPTYDQASWDAGYEQALGNVREWLVWDLPERDGIRPGTGVVVAELVANALGRGV